MYLIVGLGNPGARYEGSRHNMGRRVVELWARKLGSPLTDRRFQSRNVRTSFRQKGIVLLCPETYMNLSGKAVKACADHYRVKPEDTLLIHDDLDLPVGRLKVSRNGGAGGHKGVISVMHYLDSMLFARVKIGIGRPRYGEAIEDYVLEPFYRDETDLMEIVAKAAIQAAELFVLGGIESSMNHINRQNLANEEVKR